MKPLRASTRPVWILLFTFLNVFDFFLLFWLFFVFLNVCVCVSNISVGKSWEINITHWK